MAYLMYLYSDWMLKNAEKQLSPGVAAFLGSAAEPETSWTYKLTGPPGYETQKIYFTTGNTLNLGDVVLSGGAEMYNTNTAETRPDINAVPYDTVTQNPNSAKIYNPMFIGAYVHPRADLRYAIALSIACEFPTTQPHSLLCALTTYRQTPDDATGTDRATWGYGTNTWYPRRSGGGDSAHAQTKIYKTTLQETEYFCIVIGVSPSGEYIGSTLFCLIPADFFKDKEPVPWVGEQAEDDSETAFSPPEGGEWHDTITPRSNYDVNPYGANNVGSFKVIFPTVSSGGVIMPEVLQYIITGIYRGSSENVLNQLGQVVAEITGGNANRPAEEVQAIISAIISVHSVPVIFPTGTAGSYAQVQTTFNTISGYDVTWFALSIASPGRKTIFEWVYTTDIISRRLNCFLDFEPFTTLTLKLPFFPPVQLSPSAVFGHRLQIDYKIDILTGLLSADVSTTDDGGAYYIITTLQGNVKTSIPIMGQGAQNAVLEKISGAIVSASKYGAIVGGAAGAFSVYNEIAQSGHGVAVGDMSVDGLGAYLSPRAAYLICTHPVAAIPSSYSEEGAIVGDFLDNIGMAANLGGKVGDFAGGFASFSAVDLSGFEATDAEKAAIMALLKGGVYL